MYGITQIHTDDAYLYAATSGSLDVYEIESEYYVAYVTYSGGFNSVWANDDYVFLATSTSGAMYLSKACISGSSSSPYDLTHCLSSFNDLTTNYELTSADVGYIHGNNDTIMFVTNSGVDVVKLDPDGYRHYTIISGVEGGFLTSSGVCYYFEPTVLYSVNATVSGWDYADKEYVVGSGIFRSWVEINDVFVTECTASGGVENTLFVSTNRGAYVIDEATENYAIYYKEF